jgi:hypothetical protein
MIDGLNGKNHNTSIHFRCVLNAMPGNYKPLIRQTDNRS